MPSPPRTPALRILLAAALLASACATGAHAATFSFDTDPFAGSTALTTPGRQVVGGELFIPSFDFDTDQIELNLSVFGVDAPLNVFNGLAQDIPDDANLVVLRNLDADLVTPGNQLNAASAADLIAANFHESRPGFFIYFNSGLNLPRLVFSTDLSSTSSDLKVLARFLDQTGATGQGNLARFGPQLDGVPEPATWAVMIMGFGFAGVALRRSRRRLPA